MNSKKLALILACAAMAGTSACNEVGHFCEGGNRCDNNVITICEDNEVVQIIDCAAQNLTCDTSSWTCVGGADACTGVDCHGGTCNNGTCDCSSLDNKFTYDATCNKTGCTNSNYTLANNCVDPGDPCATVNCNNGTCNNGTCDCSSLDSKFTYDATCTKNGCTDTNLSFVGGDCVATDPCDGVDCHDGTCNNGTCDCSDLDDKFTYDATCNKTGCSDSTLSLDNGCEAVTDLCEGVVCKNETTCDETTGKCDCSGLDAKFTYDDTCEKTGCADSSLSLGNDCAECGEGDTQCVIGYDAESSKNTYSTKACEGGSWADPVGCNDGEICNADKTACVAMTEALTCEESEDFACKLVGTQEYFVVCSNGSVVYEEACLGRTACDVATQTCADVACSETDECSETKLANIRCSENPAYDGKYSAFKAEYDVDEDNDGIRDNLECTEDCTFDFDKYCCTSDVPVCDLKATYTCNDFDNTKTWKAGGVPVCDGCALTVGTCVEEGGDTCSADETADYIMKSDVRTKECVAYDHVDTLDFINKSSTSYSEVYTSPSTDYTLVVTGRSGLVDNEVNYGFEDGGPAIMFNGPKGSIKLTVTKGLKAVAVDIKPAFTAAGDRTVKISANGSECGSGTVQVDTAEYITVRCTDLNLAGEVEVSIVSEGKQVVLDNLRWNDNSGVTTDCTEGDQKCDDAGAYVCGSDGKWGMPTACPDGCDGDVCKETSGECTPGCAAGKLTVCDEEGNATVTDCGLGLCNVDNTACLEDVLGASCTGWEQTCVDYNGETWRVGCAGAGKADTNADYETGGTGKCSAEQECVVDGSYADCKDGGSDTCEANVCAEGKIQICWGGSLSDPEDCSGIDNAKTYGCNTDGNACIVTVCNDGFEPNADGTACVDSGTDPCDGVDCHGGVCSEGECTCTGIDGYDATKFEYSALCAKTGCVDSSLSLDNDCEAVTVFCTEGKCNGGTCDEETDTCDCSGLDDKFTYDDVCEKTGCANNEYTLDNDCGAATLVKCTDIGGGTVNVGALGCRTDNILAICTGTEIWDEDTAQTCVFGCANNDCVSKSAEADENGGICTDETHSAQLTPDGKGYKTDPAQCAADEPWCGTFAEMTGCWECVKDEHCGTGESCVDGTCEAAALTCPEGQAVTKSNTCAPITCSLVSIAADVAYAKFSTDFNFESSRIACGEEGTLVSGWKATEATHDAENDDAHNYQYKADLTLLELDNGSYKCAYEVKVGDNWYACDAVSEGWSVDNVVKIDDTTADSVIKSMSYERSGGDVEPTTLSLVPAADCAGYEAQDGVDSCAIDGTTVTLSFANGAKVTMALASITANYLGLVDSDNSINITDVNGLSKVKITAKLNGAAQTNSCLVSDSGNTVGELFTWTGTSAVTKEYNVTAGASSISIVGGGASTAYLRITNLVVE